MEITIQILPEFSVIIETTSHLTAGKDLIQTIFKGMSNFFTDDNRIITLCSVHIQLH